jgi:hypothetical protein
MKLHQKWSENLWHHSGLQNYHYCVYITIAKESGGLAFQRLLDESNAHIFLALQVFYVR